MQVQTILNTRCHYSNTTCIIHLFRHFLFVHSKHKNTSVQIQRRWTANRTKIPLITKSRLVWHCNQDGTILSDTWLSTDIKNIKPPGLKIIFQIFNETTMATKRWTLYKVARFMNVNDIYIQALLLHYNYLKDCNS